MKLTFRPSLFALFLVLIGVQPSLAFKLDPISRTFAPAGSEATQSYEIINDTKERIAVTVSMVQRQMDMEGKENNVPADENFLIYPPQILLEPNSTQSVKVTWVGDPNPPKELPFRLIAEQVPIKLEKPETKTDKRVGEVKIVMRYLGSVYVKPGNATPKVVVEGIETIQGAKGEKQLAIIVNNEGTAHASLKKLKLHLQVGAVQVNLQGEQLQGMNNQTVLAGNKRRFIIPYPSDLPQGTITAAVEFDAR